MHTIIIIIHVLSCLVMVGVVLLQSGKGTELGAAFGASQAIFGARGPVTFFHKVTVAAAVTFMITSLSLTVLSREAPFRASVIDDGPPAAAQPVDPFAPVALQPVPDTREPVAEPETLPTP